MSDGGTAAEADASDGGPVGEPTDTDDASYNGVFGTYPYAFRRTESRLLKSYVVLGGLLTALVAVVFTFALVQLVANTVGAAGGTFTFVRSFYIFVGLLVVVPLMAPVLLVARRTRRGGSTRAYDRAMAAGGYLFLFSLYVMLVIAAPPDLRDAPSGATAPVVDFLYGLPPLSGIAAPLLAVGIGYLLHRRYR